MLLHAFFIQHCFRQSAAIGDPLFPKASNMDALAGLRPDQIKAMFLELEHAMLNSDEVRSRISIVEEMTICAAYNRTFKSLVLSVRCLDN